MPVEDPAVQTEFDKVLSNYHGVIDSCDDSFLCERSQGGFVQNLRQTKICQPYQHQGLIALYNTKDLQNFQEFLWRPIQ